jgi:hypothetical protein
MKNLQLTACNNPISGGSPSLTIEAPPRRVAAIGDGRAFTKRRRGRHVDAVFGAGREDMSAEYVARSLARIVRKGVRSATVREIAGMPLVFSSDIPAGTFALRTADRIIAYRSGVPYVEVPCGATDVTAAGAINP